MDHRRDGGDFPGHGGLEAIPADLDQRLPRHHEVIPGVYAGDDFVVVEYTGRGAHEGMLRSSAGDIPPTGCPVEMRFCAVHHVREGRISHFHSYFDTVRMLIQIGLMPAPEEAEA